MRGDTRRASDASALLSLAYDSPTETVQQADRLLGEVLTSRERATCGRALGIALRILGDAVRSEQVLGRALEQARICGDHELEALTGMTLAVTLLYRGRSDESLALFGHDEAVQRRNEQREPDDGGKEPARDRAPPGASPRPKAARPSPPGEAPTGRSRWT